MISSLQAFCRSILKKGAHGLAGVPRLLMQPLTDLQSPDGQASPSLVSERRSRRSSWLGLALSLAFCLWVSLWAMQDIFVLRQPWLVQDDARQHVFWMARFFNPNLFLNDPIADYFQSVAPWGYTTLYAIAAKLGIAPFTLNAILPLAIALLTTIATYALTVAVLPIPFAGLLATAILNISLWMKDDIASATPRAFVYLCLAWFLLNVIQRRWWLSAIALWLTSQFYPQYVLVEAGVVFLMGFEALLPRSLHPILQKDTGLKIKQLPRRHTAVFNFSLWAIAVLCLLPLLLIETPYDPVITLTEAQNSAEFWAYGRSVFFDDDPWRFWIIEGRSGFIPSRTPTFLWFGIFLPWLLRFSPPYLQQRINILGSLFLSATGLFFLSHLLLFRLHLPSRYSHHSLKLFMSIASACVIVVAIQALTRWGKQHLNRFALDHYFTIFSATLLSGCVLLSPLWLADNFKPGYKQGTIPGIYQFLKTTPIDSLIASPDGEIDYIPSFAQRSILFGFEYAIPYHQGYYQPLKQRGVDTLMAYFSPSRLTVAEIVQQYGVDFWLVRRSSFNPEMTLKDEQLEDLTKSEFKADPLVAAMNTAMANLKAGQVPILAQDLDRCQVFAEGDYVVLDAVCTMDSSRKL